MKALALGLASFGGLLFGLYSGGFGPDLLSLRLSDDLESTKQKHGGHLRAGESALPGRNAGEERFIRLFSALAEPEILKRGAALYDALEGLKPEDMAPLFDQLQGRPAMADVPLYGELLKRWFHFDPAAAAAWLRAHPDRSEATAAWAQFDPKGAMAEALGHPNDERAASLLLAAIESLAGSSHAQAFAITQTLPAGKLRNGAVESVISTWAQTDPAAAYAGLSGVPRGAGDNSLLTKVISEWAAKDPSAAFAQLSKALPTLRAGVLGNDLINAAAEAAGRNDPRLVLEWLKDFPDELRIPPAISAARWWVQKEPYAALDWCLANGVDIARSRREDFSMGNPGVLAEAISRQCDAAIAWLEALPAGPDRDRLLERGLDDAFWLVPKDRLYLSSDPLAMHLFAELSPDSQARMASRLAQEYVQNTGLEDLYSFAQNFSTGPIRDNAIAGAVDVVSRRDASQIDRLLESATSQTEHDAIARGLVEATFWKDPIAAGTRALTIQNSERRLAALEKIAWFTASENSTAFAAWVQSQPAIPAAWRRSLLEKP